MSSPKIKLKKGDRVVVLAGRDKGARGEILKMPCRRCAGFNDG